MRCFLPVVLACLSSLSLASSNDLADRLFHLSQTASWRTLLHMPPTGQGRSAVDDPSFFLARQGPSDPHAELVASYFAFQRELGADHTPDSCRFIARWHWLQEELPEVGAWAVPTCPEFGDFQRSMTPHSISLIYASSIMNDPASAFGHAFLRLDVAKKSSPLLDFVIDHGIVLGDANTLEVFAKGLFGFSKSYYTLKPYYQKINEYHAAEAREIWEYKLKLSQEQMLRLMRHAWELQGIYSNYYYLNRNCAFNIALLLQASLFDIKLVDHNQAWILPVDLIKALAKQDLIASVTFRPSTTAKLEAIASQMSGAGTADAKYHALHPETWPKEAHARDASMLDFAAEWLRYLQSKTKASPHKYDYELRQIAMLRSKSAYHSYPEVSAQSPHAAHNQIRLGIGATSHSLILRGSPLAHSLEDVSRGYARGTELKLLDTELGYHAREGRLLLRQMSLIDLASLTAVSKVFQPWSYRLRLGLQNIDLGELQGGGMVAQVSAGYTLPILGGILYALPGLGLSQGKHLQPGLHLLSGFLLQGEALSFHWEELHEWQPVTKKPKRRRRLSLTHEVGKQAQAMIAWEHADKARELAVGFDFFL